MMNFYMWVFEEKVTILPENEHIESNQPSEMIKTCHKNVKYLPGTKLQLNVHAITELKDA